MAEEAVVFPDPVSALPPEPRTFVGPDHLALVKMLQHHVARPCLAGVFGAAGSGKSALCEKLLNTLESRRAFLRDEDGEPVHRRFWVELEGCSPGPEFEERVARAVGCASYGAAVARLSTGQPALVVLDNADDVWNRAAPDDPALAHLAACTRRGARIVVTVRQVERTSDGPAMTARLDIPPLSDGTAQALFSALAPAADADLLGAELLRRCDGSPLAVTLLAKAAGGDPAALRTAAGTGGRPGLDFALGACSVLLESGQRRAWAALSLFPAGLGRDDVVEVLQPLPRAEHLVARLHQLGLARRTATGLRVPALLRWAEPEAMSEMQMSQVWERFTARARRMIAAGQGGAWLVAHQPNLVALADHRPVPDGVLDLAFEGLLARRPSHADDTTETALVALAVAAVGEGPVPLRIVEVEATLRDRYRLEACRRLLSLMVSGSRRTGDRRGEASALESLGILAYRASQYDQAKALLSQAQEIAGDVGNPLSHADVLFEQGKVALSEGNHDQAELLLTQAQEVYDETGSRFGQASARLYRGQLAGERGAGTEAEALLSEAQDIYDEVGNELGRANARLYRGQLAAKRSEHDLAEQLLVAAMDIYESIGNELGRANARLYRGDLANRQGRRAEAESLVIDAQLIYDEIAHRLGQANARLYRGELVATRGGFDQADDLLQKAQRIYDEIGDRRGQANARYDRGKVAEIQGRTKQSEVLLAEAQDLYDSIAPAPGPAAARAAEPDLAEPPPPLAATAADMADPATPLAGGGTPAEEPAIPAFEPTPAVEPATPAEADAEPTPAVEPATPAEADAEPWQAAEPAAELPDFAPPASAGIGEQAIALPQMAAQRPRRPHRLRRARRYRQALRISRAASSRIVPSDSESPTTNRRRSYRRRSQLVRTVRRTRRSQHARRAPEPPPITRPRRVRRAQRVRPVRLAQRARRWPASATGAADRDGSADSPSRATLGADH